MLIQRIAGIIIYHFGHPKSSDQFVVVARDLLLNSLSASFLADYLNDRGRKRSRLYFPGHLELSHAFLGHFYSRIKNVLI